jgi:hypothetical protein
VPRSLAVAFGVAVLAAGCGGGHARTTTSTPPTTASTVAARGDSPLARDYRRLFADVHAMRTAAANVKRSTLLGTPAVRRTTSEFLDDLDVAKLTLKAKNRMIDHAAAAVAPVCEQCFQQLEAMRPIPAIAHSGG